MERSSSYNNDVQLARRFVILDRDGTIIVDRHYLSDSEQVELIPGVLQGLKQMQSDGLGLVVITNQSGIGRGFVTEMELDRIHRRLVDILEEEGIHLDGIYYCPHLPSDKCVCRKPGTALMDRASEQFGFNAQLCFVVGDKVSDIGMGRNAGAVTFLLRSISETTGDYPDVYKPDHYADGLIEVAQIIHNHIQRSL